jgi:23S rRNA maturation-related 3'-5' exoribonuclease YhaM
MENNEVLSLDEIIQNKIEITNLLKSTNREGIDKVIKFLNDSGYFFLYGSFKHHTYKGGLAEHSLGVLKHSLENNVSCPRDSVIIASLLHDICKTRHEDIINSEDYHGHGSKSVKIIEDFIGFKLTDDERTAIASHMHSSTKDGNECELHRLIHISDCQDAGGYADGPGKLLRTTMELLKL